MNTPSTIRAAAAVLASACLTLVACAGDDEAADPASDSQVLQVASLDSLKFDPPTLNATAGEITIEHSAGAVAHTLVIEEAGVRLVGNDDATFELEPGEYVYYCDVPGHREAGMEGILTVSG